MTDPIKIPLLNQKTDGSPVTHADLPPAAGIANTMTVHEHVRVVQYMEDKYHALLKTHQELIAKHEALKTAHDEKIESYIPTAEEHDVAVKAGTVEVVKDPIPQAELQAKLEAWKQASGKAAEQQLQAGDKGVGDLTPASKPVVFTPKVPTPAT